ncbi:hypothetical protein [Streptomyces shenzhenensis]|uniref:hypothetical protein n=1 Tax=Streptomyces shenzhenensis TaxID=943815 RepID=UPI0038D4664D
MAAAAVGIPQLFLPQGADHTSHRVASPAGVSPPACLRMELPDTQHTPPKPGALIP